MRNILFVFVLQVTHMGYIVAAANLYAQTYNINGCQDLDAIKKVLQGVQVPSFTPKADAKIHVTEEEMEKDRGNVGKKKQTSKNSLFCVISAHV